MIVVEHDLAVLDYLSDFVCCLYGVPGAYGVVTLPFSVREGINIFLVTFYILNSENTSGIRTGSQKRPVFLMFPLFEESDFGYQLLSTVGIQKRESFERRACLCLIGGCLTN